MAIEALTPAYIVSSGDFADYACFDCANEYVKQRGLTWNATSYEYTLEDPEVEHVYRVHSYDGHETDSPVACCTISNGEVCGQYLDVDLSRYGREYTLDPANNFPAWLLEAHGVSELVVAEDQLRKARYVADNLEQKYLEAQRLWQEALRDSSEAYQRFVDLKNYELGYKAGSN